MILPKRGQRLKALLTGTEPIQTSYTMSSADEGGVTFPLWVAYSPPGAERSKLAYLPFAVLEPRPADLDVAGVAEPHRERFGIAASYRVQHQVRATTTSREPGLRLLLMTVGWLFSNLWVWLKAQLLASPPRPVRPQARAWLIEQFRLDRFRDLLIEAIKALYGVQTALPYPFAFATPSKL